MRNFLNFRRWQIWIACVAILINALAPSISQAVEIMNTQTALPAFAEICSTQGIKIASSLTLPSAQQQIQIAKDPIQSVLHHMQHCQCCQCGSSHASNFAMPLPATVQVVVMDGHDIYPSLFYHSPTPLFAWATAHARAPPVLD